MSNRGLVVAKYHEDLGWLSEVPVEIKVYVYDKGDSSSDIQHTGYEYMRIANEGRDPGTFLRHIVEHYGELDDWTYFVQGHPFDHYGRKQLFKHLSKPVLGDYEELGKVVFNVVGNGNLESGNLELTKTYNEITGKEQLSFEFVWGMQIVLSKRLILRRSREFYQDLLARTIELYNDTRTLPLMERIWRAIWHDIEQEL